MPRMLTIPADQVQCDDEVRFPASARWRQVQSIKTQNGFVTLRFDGSVVLPLAPEHEVTVLRSDGFEAMGVEA